MKRELCSIALAVALQAKIGMAAAPDLLATAKQADGWVAWRVPMVSDAGELCCFSVRNHGNAHPECDLDGRSANFGTDDDYKRPSNGDTLAVYAHVAHARIDDIRAYAASCPVRSTGEIRWIDGVEPQQSIRVLSDWLDGTDGSHADHDLALVAIAYHADASATRVIAARAEPPHPRKEREDALFWLGQARGADGAAIVERYATTDGDPKLREQAIFALSQSHAGDSYAHIHAIAQSDPATHVRSQALFWMAQMQDERAAADITSALKADASDSVREEAVFALSQLEGEKADDALIALLKGDYPRDVKKQALFWLGQSGSPRAMQFFDEALTRSR
jgi:hypothetical protein